MQPSAEARIKLFGTDEPVPAATILTAGPVRCRLDNGNLRYVEVGGQEAIRAVAFIVRDRNWGTYNPRIEDLQVLQRADGFTVTYRATCADAEQSLRYTARIDGMADGKIAFAAEGEALSDFVTNRAGFVVLHPIAGVSGEPVTVLHVDGTTQESRFPALIEPDCPFRDIRALTHNVGPGLRITCRMEGDAFEMEDHRNWMDASYKTYVRPLALPWPYRIAKDERLSQRVTLTLDGAQPAATTAGGRVPSVEISVGEPTGAVMPPLGLALDPDDAAASMEVAELLRAARPAFLVIHLDPTRGHDTEALARCAEVAEAVGAATILEAVIPCRDAAGDPTVDPAVLAADLARIAAIARTASIRPTRLIVAPACDLKCTLPGSIWPKAPSWEAIAAAAREAFPGVPLGGGMLSYFTEFNRKRPPVGLFDFVGHTTCPLVHAGDDLSATETLEALPAIFTSGKAIAGEVPRWLFPTTLGMRANPYGDVPAENPGNIRQAMNRVDPRERALLGAAWYAGYLAHAARAGLAGITLGAAGGPSGIVCIAQPHARPWFEAALARVHPSWHVIAQHAAAAGRPILASTSSRPRDVQVLALGGYRPTLWLANLTGETRELRLEGLGHGLARSWLLDEAGFEAACLDPAAFAAATRPHDLGEPLRLSPYAVCRIDLG